jgi:spermidine/putrescine-binding protein
VHFGNYRVRDSGYCHYGGRPCRHRSFGDGLRFLYVLAVITGHLRTGEAVEKATIAAQRSQYVPSNTISNKHEELLSKLHQKEQQEQIQQQKIQQEELRQQLPQDEVERIYFFLNEISSCDSSYKIKEIWEKYPENTFRNAKEVSSKIASMVKFERLYGQDSTTISAFLAELKEALLR